MGNWQSLLEELGQLMGIYPTPITKPTQLCLQSHADYNLYTYRTCDMNKRVHLIPHYIVQPRQNPLKMAKTLNVSSFQNGLEIEVTPSTTKYMLKQIAESRPHCQHDHLYH